MDFATAADAATVFDDAPAAAGVHGSHGPGPGGLPEKLAEDDGRFAVGHRQVLSNILSGDLHLFQPDVLDHLPSRQRRSGSRPRDVEPVKTKKNQNQVTD